MSAKTARNRALLATTAVVMGLGLAAGAAPADAVTTHAQQPAAVADAAHRVTPDRAGWDVLWGPKTHAATHYWSTPDFVPDRKHLAVNFGCWGHDGARMKADIVRTRDKKVMKKGGYDWCHDAAQRRLDFYNAKPGTSYYMRLYLTGPKHSMWAKASDYHS